MPFKAEYVSQTEWSFYNSLNVQYKNKRIRASEFSKWAKDTQRGLYLIEVCPYWTDLDSYWPGVYLFINGELYVYFEVSRSFLPWAGNIKQIILPPIYQLKEKELEDAIEVAAAATGGFDVLRKTIVSDGNLNLTTEYVEEKDWPFLTVLISDLRDST